MEGSIREELKREFDVKKKKGKLMYIMQWVFGLLMFGMLLYFAAGEILLPEENGLNAGECSVFDAQWSRELPDGTKIPAEVPGVCKADRREPVIIETELPGNLEDKTWLCLHSSRQDMEIYIDNVLRRKYTTEGIRLFGKNSASAYIFVELKREDAGKTIRIVTVSDSGYSGRMDTIYLGERMGIWIHLLQIHGAELVFALFVGTLSIIIILFGKVLHHFYSRMIRLEYLGWGVFLQSVCLIMASRLRQFMFPNISVASGMAFFSVMLMPLPFLLYINEIQKRRYQKYYVPAGTLVVGNLAVCTGLQFLNIRDFSETSVYTMWVIFLAILLVWITMCADIYRNRIRQYPLSAVGFLAASLAGTLEMALAYQQKFTLNGMILCVGLLIFQILAVVETGQRVFRMEREKQQAVFAGEFKDRFLLSVSQEMQENIDAINGMNEKILQEGQTGMEPYAAGIQNAGKALTGLVADMMDFSGLDMGNLELISEEYETASFIEEAVHVLREKAAEKHLKVRINVDETLPSVLKGDEARNRKILMSLFSNSIKYTQEGTITFSAQGIRTEKGTFHLSLSVADTGTGIEDERLAGIFDVLPEDWRKEKKVSAKRTGLGLHMIKQLTEQMGGSIRVWSMYGEGSLFAVEIPQDVVCRDAVKTLQIQPETENLEESPPQKESPETEKPEAGHPQKENPETEKPEAGYPQKESPETEKPENENPQEEKLLHKDIGMAYCGEDAEVYHDILQAYYVQGRKYCQELPRLLDEKDWTNYGIIVHAVKSTSMTIGAPELSEKARQQESAAKEGKEAELLQGHAEFFRQYEQVLEEVRTLLPTEECSEEASGAGPRKTEHKKTKASVKDVILVVDDDNINLVMARKLLEEEYEVAAVNSGALAFQYLEEHEPDLILLDIQMPRQDGFEVMKILRNHEAWRRIPVIFLTADRTEKTEETCFRIGAVDYIAKPFVPAIMLQRVRRTLELENYRKNLERMVERQLRRITQLQQDIVITMANLIESRDGTTGEHVKRTSAYVNLLVRKVKEKGLYEDVLSPAYIDYMQKASPLHDIGKLTVPDRILQKPGALTKEEYGLIQLHAEEGGRLIQENMKRIAEKEFVDVARDMAACHHEKWAGGGYPHNLKGEEIPLAARILAIADVFDALVSERQYKKGMSLEQAFEIMEKERGKSFEPALLDTFLEMKEELGELMEKL